MKLLVVYAVEQGIALEPIRGNRASSPVDLGCTKLFLISAVTSESF